MHNVPFSIVRGPRMTNNEKMVEAITNVDNNAVTYPEVF